MPDKKAHQMVIEIYQGHRDCRSCGEKQSQPIATIEVHSDDHFQISQTAVPGFEIFGRLIDDDHA